MHSSAAATLNLLDGSPSNAFETILGSDDRTAQLQSLIELVEGTVPADAVLASERLLTLCELAEMCGELQQVARCHRGRARAFAYLGRYEDAIAECQTGRAIAIRGGAEVEAARLLLASLHPLVEMGRLDEAIDVGTMAREELDQLDETALAARADINLGITLQRMERNEEALECFTRASRALDVTDTAFGPLQSNRGESLVLTCDFPAARVAFESALRIFRDTGVALHAAIAEGNLGDLALRQGMVGEALRRFELARQALESVDAPTHLARVIAEQAEAKAFLGLNDEAITDFNAAVATLDQNGQVLEASRARYGLARLLIRLGRLESAEPHLLAASLGFAQLNHRQTLARVDLERAASMLAQGRQEEAAALVATARCQFLQGSPDAALAQVLLGRITMAQGRLGESESLLDLAASIVASLDIGLVSAELAEARGDLHSMREDHGSAAEQYRIAIDHAERLRGSLHAQRFRMAAACRSADLHGRLVSALLDAGVSTVAADTFLACERTRNRSLVEDSMAPSSGTTISSWPVSPHVEALQEVRGTINALYSRLHEDVGLESIRERLRLAEQQAAELESRLAAATDQSIVRAEPMTARTIQGCLDDRTAIVSFFVDRGSVLVHALDREHLQLHVNICSVDEVESLVEQLQFQIGCVVAREGESDRVSRITRNIDTLLTDLFDLLLRPVRNILPAGGRVVIIPHECMQRIPFAALREGTSSLIEQCEVVVCPSVSLFGWLDAQPRRITGTALVLEAADAQSPAMRVEAEAILDCLRRDHEVVALLGPDGQREAFLGTVSRASVVHVACHGRFDADRPHLSGLRLADGWLPAWSLRQQGLRANLITLGACDSGLTSTTRGGEMHGLAREFLAAGARNVLGTLWPVADEPIRGLLTGFYEQLSRQNGRARASLSLVQRQAIRSRVPVWDWAALSLIGAG